MEINGIAHIFLTASDFGRVRDFYRKLLPFLGMKPMIDSDQVYYCVGGRMVRDAALRLLMMRV